MEIIKRMIISETTPIVISLAALITLALAVWAVSRAYSKLIAKHEATDRDKIELRSSMNRIDSRVLQVESNFNNKTQRLEDKYVELKVKNTETTTELKSIKHEIKSISSRVDSMCKAMGDIKDLIINLSNK
jgi:predicted  nucleic acid-binding Zn-ribbon protein